MRRLALSVPGGTLSSLRGGLIREGRINREFPRGQSWGLKNNNQASSFAQLFPLSTAVTHSIPKCRYPWRTVVLSPSVFFSFHFYPPASAAPFPSLAPMVPVFPRRGFCLCFSFYTRASPVFWGSHVPGTPLLLVSLGRPNLPGHSFVGSRPAPFSQYPIFSPLLRSRTLVVPPDPLLTFP